MRYKVVGPPGTGKTRRLLNEVHKYVKNGTPHDRIGYFAFTRKAAGEARDRFLAKNPDLTKKDIRYFQTLHSLAFNNLGLKEENVMQEGNYKAIGETSGIQIKYASYETNNFNGIFSSSSEYLSLINLARVRQITAEQQFNRNEHLSWISKNKLIGIEKEINSYKEFYKLIDFTDMIQQFLDRGTTPKFKVIFVDEAQDLSLIQWAMIKKIEEDTNCDVWIAGDDDQAIFGWAGADVDSFIKWEAREILLDKSERVPPIIQQKALDIISRIYINRIAKDYLPKNAIGNIYERFNINGIDMSEGDWLILARTNSLLKKIPAYLKRKGYFFNTNQGNSIGKTLYEDIQTWNEFKQGLIPPDIKRQRLEEVTGETNFNINLSWETAFKNIPLSKREYMKAMISNGENLLKPPRIKVSTIHGAKGGEAHNVILYLNQTANTIKGAKKSQAKQEEEFRVWYVGVTRTIENLFLIKSKNKLKEFKL
jgi:superfamily I DNA/RNA helicase|tara:strand:+ start:985 stop:2424 length:1440 start_codon:yes stop_codon:yes gene_type:complete